MVSSEGLSARDHAPDLLLGRRGVKGRTEECVILLRQKRFGGQAGGRGLGFGAANGSVALDGRNDIARGSGAEFAN